MPPQENTGGRLAGKLVPTNPGVGEDRFHAGPEGHYLSRELVSGSAPVWRDRAARLAEDVARRAPIWRSDGPP
eukprot:9240110-Heterocapsa_arctica.AAC.1